MSYCYGTSEFTIPTSFKEKDALKAEINLRLQPHVDFILKYNKAVSSEDEEALSKLHEDPLDDLWSDPLAEEEFYEIDSGELILESMWEYISCYCFSGKELFIDVSLNTEEINNNWDVHGSVAIALAPLMIGSYATGFSGSNDSREGMSGETVFLTKEGEIIWANTLARKYFNQSTNPTMTELIGQK